MSDEPREPEGDSEDRPDDDDRHAILSRRRRFVVAALSGLALSGCASTVGNGDAAPQPDAVDVSVGTDSTPMPCLSPIPPDVVEDDAAPQPCLDFAPPDDASDG